MDDSISSGFVARRGTIEDLAALTDLWTSAGLPAHELGRFVTEFQVVPDAGGVLVAAIGLLAEGSEGLLHSEAIADGIDADEARVALWSRLQIVARHIGIVRLWTQEDAAYWQNVFRPAQPEQLNNLTATFKDPEASWWVMTLIDSDRAKQMIAEQLAIWDASRDDSKNDFQRSLGSLRLALYGIGSLVILASAILVVYVFAKRPDLVQKIMGR